MSVIKMITILMTCMVIVLPINGFIVDTNTLLQVNHDHNASSSSSSSSSSSPPPPVGILLRDIDETLENLHEIPLNKQSLWMSDQGIENIRLVPGKYPKGMEYHFDGLACLIKFTFTKEGTLQYFSKFFESKAYDHYQQCLFLGSGTTHIGFRPCLANPVVNLLPIDGQLWLTIDTATWGRVDPSTLETIPNAKLDVVSVVSNAHPACDRKTNECFVQYTCDSKRNPYTNQACVGVLVTNASSNDISVKEISRVTLDVNRLIQHSHSPCVTENFVVSKLDSFEYKGEIDIQYGGILQAVHQKEDNLWLVMNRFTNESQILNSDFAFVNNHFWNCYEENNHIFVDTVTATSNYLDSYFKDNLKNGLQWEKMFFRPQRCVIDMTMNSNTNSNSKFDNNNNNNKEEDGIQIKCTNLMKKDNTTVFDYPTFNPLYKMNKDYKYYYGIAPHSISESKLFERIIKFDASTGDILLEWSAPNIYVQEADFIPRSSSSSNDNDNDDEDDGILISLLYNSTSDITLLGLIDAISMKLVDSYPLENVIGFGAHGISKFHGKYWTNP